MSPRQLSLRGLIFDMGDVLYDATVWRRWLVQLLERMGIATDYGKFFHHWDTQYLGEVHRGARDYHDAFHAYLLDRGLPRGLVEEVEAASQARRRELEETLRPFPGVRATLARLQAADMALAVLSDSECTADRLRQRLGALSLRNHFAAVVSSADLKRTKPDPVCYRSALSAIDLSAEEVAFVGHDAEELAGARDVGLFTIAFNWQHPCEADAYLDRFVDLLHFAPAVRELAAAS